MRCALIGAVGSSAITLNALINSGMPPDAVISLPESEKGRHSDFFDIAALASRQKIAVKLATNVNDTDVVEYLKNLDLDILFVIGWSQIIKPQLLHTPRVGCIGYHPSLLPENRGRGVLAWTILQERRSTGSSLFWLDEGMDTGDILCQQTFEIPNGVYLQDLMNLHNFALESMLEKILPRLKIDEFPRVRQSSGSESICAKRIGEDGYIDWNNPASQIWNLIRAVSTPYPGAFTFYQGNMVKIWRADLMEKTKTFWGKPGQIQFVDENGCLIQCGDRKHILVRDFEKEGQTVAASKLVKVHDAFGIEIQDLYKKFLELQE